MSLIFWAAQLGKIGYQLAKGAGEKDEVREQQGIQLSSRLEITDVYEKIQKCHALHSHGILNIEEFKSQKVKILTELKYHGINQSPMEALRTLMPLLESGAISVDEMKVIKKMIEGRI